jgi:hypothetical protein
MSDLVSVDDAKDDARLRVARVVGGNQELETVSRYLPSNYEARRDEDGVITIFGHDHAGWTLDGYVIPRLASGLISAEEMEPTQIGDVAVAEDESLTL